MRRPLPRSRLGAALLALAGLGAGFTTAPAAHAQGPLADPTRPPSAGPSPGTPAARNALRAASAASAPVAPPPPPPPLLQSVQLGRAGVQASALVDGRLLRVGDKLGDAQVIAIDLQGLQLQGPRGIERLRLISAVIVQTPLPMSPAPPSVAVAGER